MSIYTKRVKHDLHTCFFCMIPIYFFPLFTPKKNFPVAFDMKSSSGLFIPCEQKCSTHTHAHSTHTHWRARARAFTDALMLMPLFGASTFFGQLCSTQVQSPKEHPVHVLRPSKRKCCLLGAEFNNPSRVCAEGEKS